MKIKTGFEGAHAYCDGIKDGLEHALKMLESHPDMISDIKQMLREGIARQEQAMSDMQETEFTKKDGCV